LLIAGQTMYNIIATDLTRIRTSNLLSHELDASTTALSGPTIHGHRSYKEVDLLIKNSRKFIKETSNVPCFARVGPHPHPQPWPWTLTLTTGSLLFPLSLRKVWSKSMTLFFVYFNS
jgi:hypothetical protein